jgi:hypothetical protein
MDIRMAQFHPAWLEHRRKYLTGPNGKLWLRPNAHLWIRHDAHRFAPPGSPRYVGKDVVRYCWPIDPNECKRQQELTAELDEMLEIRRELATLEAERRRRRLEWNKAYNPDQPRVPAGGPEGGQWTSGSEAGGDTSGQTTAETLWTSGDPESQARVQPVFLGPAVPAAIEAGLALFTWLSSRNGPDSQAILDFRAGAFRPGATESQSAIRVESLTKEQVDDACPRHAEVQAITNEAARSTDRGAYETAAAYGTAVHKKVEVEINGPITVPRSPSRDPNFRAEASVLKSREAGYGLLGSKRIDVLENPGTGTVCVYDIKTGERSLSISRMQEIADNVSLFYPGTQRIIVTEVRPGR